MSDFPNANTELATPARTSRRAWLAVIAVGMGAFTIVTTEFLAIGMLSEVANGLHVSDGTAGLMITVPGLVAAVTAPMLIIFARRVDRKIFLLALIVDLVVSNVIASLAQNFATMLVARLLLGVAVGGFWAVGASMGFRLVAAKDAGRATATIMSGISIGTVVGLPGGALIADATSWRAAFVVSTAVALIAFVTIVVTVPSLPSTTGSALSGFGAVLSSRRGRLGVVCIVLMALAQFSAYTYIRPFLSDTAGFGSGAVTTLLLAYGLAGLAGTSIGGSYVGQKQDRTLITGATLIAVCVATAAAVSQTGWAVVVLVILWGAAFGLVPLSLQTWMATAVDGQQETGSAILVTVFQLFLGVGSWVGGLMVDHVGVRGAMYLAAALSVVAVGCVVSFRTAPGLRATPPQ